MLVGRQGSPDAPRCGFSSKVVGALRKTGVPFGTFDILEDEDVRQGLKKFSDWPTYPQLYAGALSSAGWQLPSASLAHLLLLLQVFCVYERAY